MSGVAKYTLSFVASYKGPPKTSWERDKIRLKGILLKRRDKHCTSPSLFFCIAWEGVCILESLTQYVSDSFTLSSSICCLCKKLLMSKKSSGPLEVFFFFFFFKPENRALPRVNGTQISKVWVQFSLNTKGEWILIWAKCILPPLIYSTLFWQTLRSWKLAFLLWFLSRV